jgi:hypothetical protein
MNLVLDTMLHFDTMYVLVVFSALPTQLTQRLPHLKEHRHLKP